MLARSLEPSKFHQLTEEAAYEYRCSATNLVPEAGQASESLATTECALVEALGPQCISKGI